MKVNSMRPTARMPSDRRMVVVNVLIDAICVLLAMCQKPSVCGADEANMKTL
jgi:hypothetical protein